MSNVSNMDKIGVASPIECKTVTNVTKITILYILLVSRVQLSLEYFQIEDSPFEAVYIVPFSIRN